MRRLLDSIRQIEHNLHLAKNNYHTAVRNNDRQNIMYWNQQCSQLEHEHSRLMYMLNNNNNNNSNYNSYYNYNNYNNISDQENSVGSRWDNSTNTNSTNNNEYIVNQNNRYIENDVNNVNTNNNSNRINKINHNTIELDISNKDQGNLNFTDELKQIYLTNSAINLKAAEEVKNELNEKISSPKPDYINLLKLLLDNRLDYYRDIYAGINRLLVDRINKFLNYIAKLDLNITDIVSDYRILIDHIESKNMNNFINIVSGIYNVIPNFLKTLSFDIIKNDNDENNAYVVLNQKINIINIKYNEKIDKNNEITCIRNQLSKHMNVTIFDKQKNNIKPYSLLWVLDKIYTPEYGRSFVVPNMNGKCIILNIEQISFNSKNYEILISTNDDIVNNAIIISNF